MTHEPNNPQPRTAPLCDRASAASLCERLQDTAVRIADLLAEETALLKANRPREIAALQDEKRRLSAAYARDYCTLKANARFVGDNAPSQVDRLKRALRTLRRQAEDSAHALEATRAVSQGLVAAIHEIARKKASGPQVYTAGASVAAPLPARATAIAVDRAL